MSSTRVNTWKDMPRPASSPYGQDVVKGSESATCGPVRFDPDQHLNFTLPAKVLTMTDIQLPANTGISPVAVSEPFPLFSEAAVVEMRREVFSDDTWENCGFSSNVAACQLRGMCPRYASFVYEAWKNPKTLAIISKIAGIDLVPSMDYEIGHVNVSVKGRTPKPTEAGSAAEADDKPIVDWHTDSYPFVCVLMLSDASTMVGGETALRTGGGEVFKVRGPQMGSAVVLQGRYIEHQALKATGTDERITMVTSFRPRSSAVTDDTTLSNVRPVSDLSELYTQFSEYRLEILAERVQQELKKVREARRTSQKCESNNIRNFLQEQLDFLAHTKEELVDESRVVMGHVGDPFPVSAPGLNKRPDA